MVEQWSSSAAGSVLGRTALEQPFSLHHYVTLSVATSSLHAFIHHGNHSHAVASSLLVAVTTAYYNSPCMEVKLECLAGDQRAGHPIGGSCHLFQRKSDGGGTTMHDKP